MNIFPLSSLPGAMMGTPFAKDSFPSSKPITRGGLPSADVWSCKGCGGTGIFIDGSSCRCGTSRNKHPSVEPTPPPPSVPLSAFCYFCGRTEILNPDGSCRCGGACGVRKKETPSVEPTPPVVPVNASYGNFKTLFSVFQGPSTRTRASSDAYHADMLREHQEYLDHMRNAADLLLRVMQQPDEHIELKNDSLHRILTEMEELTRHYDRAKDYLDVKYVVMEKLLHWSHEVTNPKFDL